MSEVIVDARRTCCHNGRTMSVKITVERYFYKSLDSWWYQIIKGNVTGYESIRCDKLSKDGWFACMGTEGKWDTLFVPAKSVAKILEVLGATEKV